MSRRKFIKNTFLGSTAASSISFNHKDSNIKKFKVPRIISTWNHGLDANKVAWKNLKDGKGLVKAIKYLINKRQVNIYKFNNLQVTINSPEELKHARLNYKKYFTL